MLFLDSAYAVVTAMLILNSDLHSQHRPHQTSNPTRFLNSIREIPCCAGVSTDEIHDIYNSIKSEPLPMPPDAQLDFPSKCQYMLRIFYVFDKFII